MKNRPLLALTLVSSSLAAGCAWFPWNSDSTATSAREVHGRIVPHARIRDGADSAAAFHALGRHLQREGKLDDAERAYLRALEFDPAYAEARNALAVLAATRGNLAQAIEMLSSLVASHPDQPHLLTNLGYAHYLKGEYALAKERLMQALSIAPDNDSAQQKLALVKQKLGEPADERDAIHQIVEKSRTSKEATDHSDRSPVVKLNEGVYQLIRSLPIEEAKSYAARCDLTAAPQPAPKLMPAATTPAATTPAAMTPAATTPTATTPTATTPATTSPDRPVAVTVATTVTATGNERLRLELVNGNGITRLARTVRDLISGPHWQVVRVLNHEEFSVAVTRIEYAKHRYGAAQELADALGVAAQLRPNYQQGDTQLRVVLGKDFRTTEGLRERVASSMPLLVVGE